MPVTKPQIYDLSRFLWEKKTRLQFVAYFSHVPSNIDLT